MATPLVGSIWTALKAQLEADTTLTGYFTKRYYRKTPVILTGSEYPMLHVFPLSNMEGWIAVPKRFASDLTLGVSAKVNQNDLDTIIDKLFEAEAIAKNALDKDLQLAGKAIVISFGETTYDYLGETILDARFTVLIKSQLSITGGR